MSALSLEGISQDYETLPVLRNISFTLGEGEHLGILGPSGCGKSTLLRLVTGLERPSRGRVLWHGEEPVASAFIDPGHSLVPTGPHRAEFESHPGHHD